MANCIPRTKPVKGFRMNDTKYENDVKSKYPKMRNFNREAKIVKRQKQSC